MAAEGIGRQFSTLTLCDRVAGPHALSLLARFLFVRDACILFMNCLQLHVMCRTLNKWHLLGMQSHRGGERLGNGLIGTFKKKTLALDSVLP